MDDQRFDRLARVLGNRRNRRQALVAGAGAITAGIGLSREDASAGAVCSLTCPTNLTVDTGPGLCSAVVNYPAPTTIGSCGTITCSPPSGATYPSGVPGETTVTCMSSNGPTCSFLITVQDVEIPVITCPADIEVVSAAPIAVNYTTTATDNCPGVTAVCSPPSGSDFEPGTTAVTCSAVENAPDQSTVTCTFNVTVTAPTATPTEESTTGPTEVPATEVPATQIPGTVAPTNVPVDPTPTTAPVTELPNTGSGSGGSVAGKALPIAVAGSGIALLARLGLRRTTPTDSEHQ
jgi:hypothetical protein